MCTYPHAHVQSTRSSGHILGRHRRGRESDVDNKADRLACSHACPVIPVIGTFCFPRTVLAGLRGSNQNPSRSFECGSVVMKAAQAQLVAREPGKAPCIASWSAIGVRVALRGPRSAGLHHLDSTPAVRWPRPNSASSPSPPARLPRLQRRTLDRSLDHCSLRLFNSAPIYHPNARGIQSAHIWNHCPLEVGRPRRGARDKGHKGPHGQYSIYGVMRTE